jgi:hypothetical protein
MKSQSIALEYAEYAIDGVLPEQLNDDWDDAWPWLEKAIDRFPHIRNKYTEASIFRKILSSEKQLWIAWSIHDECIVGAAITEIIIESKYPNELLMAIPLVGGKGWNKWGDSLWNTLKAWGRSKGCTYALGYGRKCWQRLYGFDPIGKTEDGIIVMIRRLKDK